MFSAVVQLKDGEHAKIMQCCTTLSSYPIKPANIKIQRAGPDVPGVRFELMPSADLER